MRGQPEGVTSRGRPACSWLALVSVAELVFLYLPIAVLILFSFNASRFSAIWQGFTLQWYVTLARDTSLLAALQTSLVIAVLSTIITTVLGLMLALAMHRAARPSPVLEALVLLPLIIPEVMLGVALLLFFVAMKVPLGVLTVILGHVTFNLPVVVVVLLARLRKLDPSLVEAAQDLGATPWQAFRQVTLPLLAPALIGAMLLAFTISLDDFVVTFFTTGPGGTTLPVKVYSMLKTGISPVVNALSAGLVLVSMALIGLALALQREAATSP